MEYDYLEDRFEVISQDDPPERIFHADFIFVEDVPLDFDFIEDFRLPQEVDNYLRAILNVTQFLKKHGKIIFFSPLNGKVWESSSLLSVLFPVRFTEAQKEIILMFLLFRKTLLKTDLLTLLNSIRDNSIFQISSRNLDSLLQSLQYHDKVIKESRGRYTCRARNTRKGRKKERKKDPKLPAGESIVRYRSFLKHRIQLFIGNKYRKEISELKHIFNYHTINAAELTKKFKRCPHITYLQMLLQEFHDNLISQEAIESLVENSLDQYEFDRSNFSRIDAEFEKYDPYRVTQVDLTRKKQNFTYHQKKPLGRSETENRKNNHELKREILQKVTFLWHESKFPVSWSRSIDELGIKRSTGYRLIKKLFTEKKLKPIKLKRDSKTKYCLLEPKKLDMTDSKFEFRGRPPLYLVPFDAEINLDAQQWCGKCHMFTRTHQCELNSKLLNIGKPESIRNIKLREVLKGKEEEVSNPQIHPHMRACDQFEKRVRDFELRSLRVQADYRATAEGVEVKVLKYICHLCGAVMPQLPNVRTFKCPKCYSKYTRRSRKDGTEFFKVNVDVHSVKQEKIRKISGIEELESEKTAFAKKKALTKRIRTTMLKKKFPNEKKTSVNYQLRKKYKRKYGTVKFFKPRILANLLSATLATRELKIFGIVADEIIDGHVYVQLEQILQSATNPTLKQFQTAERVIAKQYFQVYGSIMEYYGFKLLSRKLMRYVKEDFEHPYRGSKGYTPGNCLVNNAHKVRYEETRQLCYTQGFGWDCPGVAEHTHPQFGLVLDLSDPVKYADRFTLLQAVIKGQTPYDTQDIGTYNNGEDVIRQIELQLTENIKEKITHDDIYSALGRQDQDVFFVKTNSFKKLIRLKRVTDQKTIYRLGKYKALYEEIPLGKAFEEFIQQLAQNLMTRNKLSLPFVYAPKKEDYSHLYNLIKAFNVEITEFLAV